MTKRVCSGSLLFMLLYFGLACLANDTQAGVYNATKTSTGHAITKQITNRLQVFGVIESTEKPTITAEVPGVVAEVYVDEGQEVVEGQLLATLDLSNYLIAESLSRYELLKKKEELAKRVDHYKRISALSATDNISQEALASTNRDIAIDRLSVEVMRRHHEIALQDIKRANIVSPINGVVTKRHASKGDYLGVSMPILSIIDDKLLRVRLKVSPSDASRMVPGQRIAISSVNLPDKLFETTVEAIVPVIDAKSNSLDVLASIQDPLLISGMRIEASVYIREAYDALLVPERALFRREDKYYLYVLKDGRAHEQYVEVGLRHADLVEIIKGITSQTVILLDVYQGISDGALANELGVFE
ncbi:efflux RND transporter periplasmic adaptor subunit [Spongiibacter sp. KMU-166]|uniref:Efflux RND transporter periplasmic adaptor subunit n=1 Tax=Spongiibacter thalassae TaxID=2721624 RepID=A0ABX1GA63_9GAMM|nr:efflux RND transporter periplasmic adaptor subunit [Spongiibacter thalassae]NKI15826.1 efflux RND transporter periplasmic adaptor subunit [Spongiibacter thalassae]